MSYLDYAIPAFFVTLILVIFLGMVLAPADALPTGYTNEELNCGDLAGIPMTNILIDTHLDATGDFISRHTRSLYESTDNQGTQIGYTSKDAANEPFHLKYDLTQTYNEGNPTINAAHLMETYGGAMSAEEAGVAYTEISSNSSNTVRPSTYSIRGDYTSMMSGPSTFAGETSIANSLTTDHQPTTLSMKAELSGLGDEEMGEGATFWNWEATYDHQLQNHLDNANFKNITGNESFHTYEFGVVGGTHKFTGSLKGELGSAVAGLLFDKKKPSKIPAPLSDTPTGTAIPIAPVDDSLTHTTTTDELPANLPEYISERLNITSNITTNLTTNTTEIQEELAGYSIASYNSKNLNL